MKKIKSTIYKTIFIIVLACILFYFIVFSFLFTPSSTRSDYADAQNSSYLNIMANSNEDYQSDSISALHIPSQYQKEVQDNRSNVFVSIDANVKLPEVDTLSTYSVTPLPDHVLSENHKDLFNATTESIFDSACTLTIGSTPYTSTHICRTDFTTSAEKALAPTRTFSQISDVETLLEELAITGLSLVSDTTMEKYYYDANMPELTNVRELIFMRTYNKVPSVYTKNEYILSTFASTLPNKWHDEYVKVLIRNSEIIDILWMEPYENIICTQEKVSLLSFPTISCIFEQALLSQANIYNHNSQSDERWKTAFHVTEVELGMKKITTDKNQVGVVVPVWNFHGDVTVSLEGTSIEQVTSNLSLLTINAITGTIVNNVTAP